MFDDIIDDTLQPVHTESGNGLRRTVLFTERIGPGGLGCGCCNPKAKERGNRGGYYQRLREVTDAKRDREKSRQLKHPQN